MFYRYYISWYLFYQLWNRPEKIIGLNPFLSLKPSKCIYLPKNNYFGFIIYIYARPNLNSSVAVLHPRFWTGTCFKGSADFEKMVCFLRANSPCV